MKIGLTYDLRNDYLAEGYSEEETAEFDRPDTIEAIEAALLELGYQTDRIGNAKRLVARLAQGDRWDLVFNIAEGLHGLAREAQVPAILDVYDIPYTFSDPLVLSLALHKGLTKTVVRQAGIATPGFRPGRAAGRRRRRRPALPAVRQAGGRGHQQGHLGGLENPRPPGPASRSASTCLQQFRQPVLVETFLSGREFTVGVTGTGAEAEVARHDGNPPPARGRGRGLFLREQGAVRGTGPLPAGPAGGRPAGRRGRARWRLAAWRVLDCRDGGRVDVRCDAHGQPHFLEVNPLPGLHPQHSDLPILCGFAGDSLRRPDRPDRPLGPAAD